MRRILSWRMPFVLVVFAIAVAIAATPESTEPVSAVGPQAVGAVNIPATDDTWIEAGDAGANLGTSTALYVRKTYRDGQDWYGATLLRFDVAAYLPPGALIDSATLTLQAFICLYAPPVNVGAYRVTSPWSEGTVTFATRPSSETSGANTRLECQLPGAHAHWNITSLATYWQSHPAANYGLELRGPATGDEYEHGFYTKDFGQGKDPILAVTYHMPTTPTPTPTRKPGTVKYLPVFMRQYVPSSTPTIIFSDNFNSGTLSGWNANGGGWGIVNFYLRGVLATDNAWYIKNASGSNFTYEGDVNIISGNAVGLTFRSSANGTSSYDAILDVVDGVFKISKRPGYIVLASFPWSVSRNRWYHVKVVANGNTIEGYLDGVKRLTVTDNNFASGQFGVMLYRATAAYDNLEARTLP